MGVTLGRKTHKEYLIHHSFIWPKQYERSFSPLGQHGVQNL